MKFAEVIGQEHIKDQIINLINDGRMPHATMLSGAPGVGKLPLAIATAQYLCCENATHNDSCGKCSSCIKFAKLAHPDLHFTFPIAKNSEKNINTCDDVVNIFRRELIENAYLSLDSWLNTISEGKTGVIYKQEGDAIIRKLSMKPYESKHQILIIWAPEKMNVDCGNHLLKFIEEPPADTYFILVTDNEDDILRTIYSRTQKIYVPPISLEKIKEYARKIYDIEDEQLSLLTRLAQGSWSNFISELLAEDEKGDMFDNFVFMMRLSWTLNMKDLITWSEKMASYNRDKQKIYLQLSQKQIRETFISRLQAADLQYMNKQEKAFVDKFSQFVHENNIEDIMNALQLAENQIEQNVNSKIIFFHLPFILYKLIKRDND